MLFIQCMFVHSTYHSTYVRCDTQFMEHSICYMFRQRAAVTRGNYKTGKDKDKTVPLQAWSGPEGFRKLRFPDFMTTAQDGGKVVSLTHRPPLPPRKYTWYSFLLEPSRTKIHNATGRIMSLKNSNDTIGNRTRDLPVCSLVP